MSNRGRVSDKTKVHVSFDIHLGYKSVCVLYFYSGILIAKKKLFINRVPHGHGGGTVQYVSITLNVCHINMIAIHNKINIFTANLQ